MKQIPIPNAQARTALRIAGLDGADFYFHLAWSERSGWYLGLSDATDDPIFAPKRLCVGVDLLAGCTDPRRPPGALVLVDQSLSGLPPAFDELGPEQRCHLIYLEKADIPEVDLATANDVVAVPVS